MEYKPIINIKDNRDQVWKIEILNYIENFINSTLQNIGIYQETEDIIGNPELNDQVSKKDTKNSSNIDDASYNYFSSLENKNIDKAIVNNIIVETSISIFHFLEEKFAEKGKKLDSIDLKKQTKILDKIIIEWFKNKNISHPKLESFLNKHKQTREEIEKYILLETLQEFFNARGNFEKRKGLLLSNLQNIFQAIQVTRLEGVANYLNLEPGCLIRLLDTYNEEKYKRNLIDIPDNILLNIIDMLDKNVPLRTALNIAEKNDNIKISNAVFWRVITKIDKKYTVQWYKQKRKEFQKEKETMAINIIGQENIKYLKELSILKFKEIQPYLNKIKQALLLTNNYIVCNLLNKNQNNLRHVFQKYEPGWWEKHMKK